MSVHELVNGIQFLNPLKTSPMSSLPTITHCHFSYFHLVTDFWCYQHLISLWTPFIQIISIISPLLYLYLYLLPPTSMGFQDQNLIFEKVFAVKASYQMISLSSNARICSMWLIPGTWALSSGLQTQWAGPPIFSSLSPGASLPASLGAASSQRRPFTNRGFFGQWLCLWLMIMNPTWTFGFLALSRVAKIFL